MTMQMSENVADLATALAKAQGEMGDAEFPGEIESGPIVAVANAFFPMKHRKGGRRKADEPLIARFAENIVFGAGECWYWRKVRPLGYGACYLMGEKLAHRVSWRLHFGDIPDGLFVLHKCDVRNCVNPDHLFLGTRTDNMRDMRAKGRGAKTYKRKTPSRYYGELCACAKLNNAKVRDIRRRLKDGEPGAALAREYEVTKGMIYHIAHNRAWTHEEAQL